MGFSVIGIILGLLLMGSGIALGFAVCPVPGVILFVAGAVVVYVAVRASKQTSV